MSGKFHNLLCFFGFRMWQTYLNDNDSECTPQVKSIDSLIYVRRRINKAMLVEFGRFDLPSRDESVDMRGGYESGGGRLISNCDRAIPNYLLILTITSCTHSLILITTVIPNVSSSHTPPHLLTISSCTHSRDHHKHIYVGNSSCFKIHRTILNANNFKAHHKHSPLYRYSQYISLCFQWWIQN